MSSTAGRALEGAWTEWLLRAFALLAYGIGVARLAHAWAQDHGRWTLLLLLVTEGYTLLMVLFARRASLRDMSPGVVVATVYAMFYFALLDPEGVTRVLPESVGVALQISGTLWQFAAKIVLGRSFGLLPAQRGIVMSGPYRVVRHPIYLGYLVGSVGFILVNFSWFNLTVFFVLYAAQVFRMQREEAVLSTDAGYRSYQRSVRWRVLPFLY